MSELKTLKDMQNTDEETYRICACGSTKESHGLNYIDEAKLKQEAIKQIQYYLKINELQCAIEFQHFFNITEDDLKSTQKDEDRKVK